MTGLTPQYSVSGRDVREHLGCRQSNGRLFPRTEKSHHPRGNDAFYYDVDVPNGVKSFTHELNLGKLELTKLPNPLAPKPSVVMPLWHETRYRDSAVDR